MIQIDVNQFEQLLPFVAAASEDVFTKMQPSFETILTILSPPSWAQMPSKRSRPKTRPCSATPETMSYWPPSSIVSTPTTSS